MTLRRTLLLAVAYVLLLAVVAFGVPLAISLRDRVDAEVKGQAQSQADLLAASAPELLGADNRKTLDRLVSTSAESVRGRVVVVDSQGALIADSVGGSEMGADFSTRPEIAAALGGSTYQETRHSDTLSADILATAVPILHQGRVVGAVRVTQSVAAVDSAVRRSIVGIVLLGLAVLALGVIAGALIAQRIARPIRRLADSADAVAAGDLDARAPVEGTTEQRTLARSFNDMTGRVGRMLDSQREFVADSSHQLRTPLTGLRLQIEEIQRLTGDPEERAAADAALHEVDRLAQIVDELLVLSRAGEHDLPAEEIRLGDAADRAAERWRRAADAKEIRLIRSSAGGGGRCGAPRRISTARSMGWSRTPSSTRPPEPRSRSPTARELSASSTAGPAWLPARRRRCSSGSSAAAPASRVRRGRASACRSPASSRASGMVPSRSATATVAARSPSCASRSRSGEPENGIDPALDRPRAGRPRDRDRGGRRRRKGDQPADRPVVGAVSGR